MYGKLRLVVHYNDKELYNNGLDLCTAEKPTDDDRIIFCPIKKGIHYYMKEVGIPTYIPKVGNPLF